MAFTTDEKVRIRAYVGIGQIFEDSDPRIVQAIQSLENRGIEVETLVRGFLTKLAALETQIEASYGCLATGTVNNIERDGVRALMVLEQQGRKLIGRLCTALSLNGPIRDYFAHPEVQGPPRHFNRWSPTGGWPQ